MAAITPDWPDTVEGDEFFRSLFPNLKASFPVDLHELQLHREACALRLTFDMLGTPDALPKKWKMAGHDTVQVRLLALGVSHLEVRGWGAEVLGTLTVPSIAGGRIMFRGHDVSIGVRAETLHVDHITAYTSPARMP